MFVCFCGQGSAPVHPDTSYGEHCRHWEYQLWLLVCARLLQYTSRWWGEVTASVPDTCVCTCVCVDSTHTGFCRIFATSTKSIEGWAFLTWKTSGASVPYKEHSTLNAFCWCCKDSAKPCTVYIPGFEREVLSIAIRNHYQACAVYHVICIRSTSHLKPDTTITYTWYECICIPYSAAWGVTFSKLRQDPRDCSWLHLPRLYDPHNSESIHSHNYVSLVHVVAI